MYTYNKQYIDNNDIKAVIKALKSEFITQGNQINEFEKRLKSYFNSKFASAVSSGTAALHLSGLALGWKKNDIIITTPLTFLATANCIVMCGSKPEFVDIEHRYGNIDLNLLEDKAIYLKKRNKKIKSVIGVDYAGCPINWKDLSYLSKKYNFSLINDNCHAIGAKYCNDTGYAVKYADIVTQSYHAVKNITMGEGGSIITNNRIIDSKVKLLRSHGMERKKDILNKIGPWHYDIKKIGYNYRINDFQCALGISQLKKLNQFVKKRNALAKIYFKELNDNDIFYLPKTLPNSEHSYHLFPIRIDFKKNKISKLKFFSEMKRSKIKLQVHYRPIHLQPFYKNNFKTRKGQFPVSENFYDQEVSLPLYYSLNKNDIVYICNEMKYILSKLSC